MATITKEQVESAHVRNGLYRDLRMLRTAMDDLQTASSLLSRYCVKYQEKRVRSDPPYVDDYDVVARAIDRVERAIEIVELELLPTRTKNANTEEPAPAITPSKEEVEKP